MRLSLVTMAVLALMVFAVPPSTLQAVMQEALPRCVSVEPMSGKVGTEIVVTGENLGKEHVAELYFTDGKNDIKVVMSEQTATEIKCKIPPKVEVGVRYKLMVLTKGKEPKLIEQPVRVEIEQ
jgi:hypothetical protein